MDTSTYDRGYTDALRWAQGRTTLDPADYPASFTDGTFDYRNGWADAIDGAPRASDLTPSGSMDPSTYCPACLLTRALTLETADAAARGKVHTDRALAAAKAAVGQVAHHGLHVSPLASRT